MLHSPIHEPPLLLSKLRAEWANLRARVHRHSNPDDGIVHSRDILRVYAVFTGYGTAIAPETMPMVNAHPELVARSIVDFFVAVDLQFKLTLGETEWLHHGLLERQAPSQHDMERVNGKLREWLKVDSGVQERLLQDFLRSCEGYPDPGLTGSQATKIIKNWIERGSLDCGSLPTAVMLPIHHLQRLLRSKEFQSEENFTYYDYLVHMLGLSKAKVHVYKYDLSGGHAQWLSPALLGEEVQGIWHTSIVVFDREYWFAGHIISSDNPGTSHWGEPTQIHEMPGWTLRSMEELIYFLRTELCYRFTVERYDILTNNCNHFTDAVCMFLLNTHAPNDIVHQSDYLLDHNTNFPLKMLRPIFNKVYGGGRDQKELPLDESVVTVQREQQTLICPGSFVSWEYRPGWRRLARLVAMDEDTQLCQLQWFDVYSGHQDTVNGIPIDKLQPTLTLASNEDVSEVTLLQSSTPPVTFIVDEPPSVPCRTQQTPRPKRQASKRLCEAV